MKNMLTFGFVLALVASVAAREVAVVFDSDFTAVGQTVDLAKAGTFKGVLPQGWSENWVGWKKARATAEVMDGAWRVTAESEETTQFQHGLGNFVARPGVYRLEVEARTGRRPFSFGVRLGGAPYTSYWQDEFSSRPFARKAYLFRIRKDQTRSGHVGLFLYTPQGTVDIRRMRLVEVTEDELFADVRRPATNVLRFVRHTRFPLGLPNGWNVGREAVTGRVAAGTAPDGMPTLKFSSPQETELFSEPWQTSRPGQPNAVSFLYRATGSWRVTAFTEQTWKALGSRMLAETSAWTRCTFTVKPAADSPAQALRFSGSGTLELDRIDYALPSAPPLSNRCEVALAVVDGEIAAATHIQFLDERPLARGVVLAVPEGAVLRRTVTDLTGRTVALPDHPLAAAARADFDFAYGLEAFAPRGQFRLEAWVEKDGTRLSPVEELVVTRLPRPRFWKRDAPASPFGAHLLAREETILLAKACGINWTRLHDAGTAYSGWSALEREKGVWTFYDREINAYRRHGIKIFAQLGTAPTWATTFAADGFTRENYFTRYLRPLNDADWLNYVRTYVGRYRGVIDEYFIWNEPWGRWWKTGYNEKHHDPSAAEADFAAFSKITYDAVKAVDPAIAVSGFNSTSGSTGTDWSRKLLENGAMDACDEIDYHYYTPQARLDAVKAARLDEDALRPIRAVHPDLLGKPVVMSEGQGASSGGGGVRTHLTGLAVQSIPFAPETRADYDSVADRTVRYGAELLAEGVKRYFLYSMHSYVTMAVKPAFLTLLGADGFAHPALVAQAQLAEALEGATFVSRGAVGADGVELVFARDGRRVRLCTELTRKEAAELLAAHPGHVFDLYGNPLAVETWAEGSLLYVWDK